MLRKEHWACVELLSKGIPLLDRHCDLSNAPHVLLRLVLHSDICVKPGQKDFMVDAPWLAPCLGPLSGQMFYLEESSLVLSFLFCCGPESVNLSTEGKQTKQLR